MVNAMIYSPTAVNGAIVEHSFTHPPEPLMLPIKPGSNAASDLPKLDNIVHESCNKLMRVQIK